MMIFITQSINNDLFLTQQSILSPAHLLMYTSASSPLVTMRNGYVQTNMYSMLEVSELVVKFVFLYDRLFLYLEMHTYMHVLFQTQAAQMLVTRARHIAVLPLSQLSIFQDDIYFVIRNGPSMCSYRIYHMNHSAFLLFGVLNYLGYSANILGLFNTSTFLYMDNIATSVTIMKGFALGLTIGSIVILAAVMLIIVRPVVYAVEDNKSGI